MNTKTNTTHITNGAITADNCVEYQRTPQDEENDRRSAQWKRNQVEEARRSFLRQFPNGRVLPKD